MNKNNSTNWKSEDIPKMCSQCKNPATTYLSASTFFKRRTAFLCKDCDLLWETGRLNL